MPLMLSALTKGRQMRIENMPLKLYPLTFKGFRLLHVLENEKHFKELKIKSGSNHLVVKSFFNSWTFLISLLCSMIMVFGFTVKILIFSILT